MTAFNKERVLALIDKIELVPCEGRGPVGWVYFIVCAETRYCKIGFTAKDPQKRLKSLQTGSPGELALILMQPGTHETERALHERFASSNVRGEWFEVTDELRAYMVAALWAVAEVFVRQGTPLPIWVTSGVRHTLDELGCVSEGLCSALEAA